MEINSEATDKNILKNIHRIATVSRITAVLFLATAAVIVNVRVASDNWDRGDANEQLENLATRIGSSNICASNQIDGTKIPFTHSLLGYFKAAGVATVDRSGILNDIADYSREKKYIYLVGHNERGTTLNALVNVRSSCPARHLSPG